MPIHRLTRYVYVDGVNKGEVYKLRGRWYWRRGPIAVEPFARGSVARRRSRVGEEVL